ncbi:MAG TPA: aminotransferase class III-fold pyridoxal phosphate-dependent enzyme, partial [Aggregatilineales bacterium]|nr:aminotransferase class III-fold pyridoxal phosphate-dependent enzyme [Aggregatilineales bacterium]
MFAKERLSPVWFHITDRVMSHGEGAYVWDTEGNRYLDFTSGIGVTNTGHSHPRVVKAIQEQAAKFIHAQVNIYYHDRLFDLIQALQKVVPAPLDTFFFSNSGAEAVEAAVKLARYTSHKPNIIVFQGGFHGRTAQTMAMTTSKTSYRKHYQPLPGGIFVAPFPYWYHYGWDAETASQWA